MGRLFTNRDALAEWARTERERGRRLVFTNGCYDLLHVGHIRLLQEARAAGDLLLVAVNSDASVTRLKGAGRPIVPLLERMEMLAALACVDAVAYFDEPDPLALILLTQPNVLVKGADWGGSADAPIIGRSEVEGWGGKVIRFPIQPGYSTTNIVERIATLGARQEEKRPDKG